MFKRLTRCSLFLGILFIAACETPKHIPSVGQKDVVLSKDARVVFGKISVVTSAGSKSWKGDTCSEKLIIPCPDAFIVYVLPREGGKATSHVLSGDGSFNWVLKPGEYFIIGFMYELARESGKPQRLTGRIAGRFFVPADEPISYLGTLKIFMAKRRYLVAVSDEFESAKAGVKSLPGAPKQEPTKRLMTIERISKEERVVLICNDFWSIECTDEHRGVGPIAPEVTRQEFPQADTLTPTFRWKASPDPRDSYDLIIYEAVQVGEWGANQRILTGPIVEYAQGIKTNSYKLPKALKPNTKYFWSVRLRRDNVVSTWSTLSYKYFAFFIIGFASGYGHGLYFNFSTPG